MSALLICPSEENGVCRRSVDGKKAGDDEGGKIHDFEPCIIFSDKQEALEIVSSSPQKSAGYGDILSNGDNLSEQREFQEINLCDSVPVLIAAADVNDIQGQWNVHLKFNSLCRAANFHELHRHEKSISSRPQFGQLCR